MTGAEPQACGLERKVCLAEACKPRILTKQVRIAATACLTMRYFGQAVRDRSLCGR